MKSFNPHATAAVLGLAALGVHGEARAQADSFFLGQLQQFGASWCPAQWSPADGSLLSIAENTALFSLLGTQFGGDGVTTFALPDLRDRAPTGMSSVSVLGTASGQTAATLTLGQLPVHGHGFNGDPTPPASNSPADSMMGLFPSVQPVYAPTTAMPDTPMNAGMVVPAGGSQPFPTQMPALAVNWCIALEGVFPSRP